MRFLADESCDFTIVRALRRAGHDVLAVAEVSPRADDPDVMRLALDEQRVLLTEDRHFGGLVYAYGHRSCGVLYLRYPMSARERMARDVVQLVEQQGERLRECFVVIQPGRIRVTQPLGG